MNGAVTTRLTSLGRKYINENNSRYTQCAIKR